MTPSHLLYCKVERRETELGDKKGEYSGVTEGRPLTSSYYGKDEHIKKSHRVRTVSVLE